MMNFGVGITYSDLLFLLFSMSGERHLDESSYKFPGGECGERRYGSGGRNSDAELGETNGECPENIIRVVDDEQNITSAYSYVLVSWGRAVLEDRDSPTMNLQFSSAYALQNGKLCLSSDTESLVYVMHYICSGKMHQQDSIESALQWRQENWGKRVIQQQIGKVSTLLKAFADYIDSLCGTPYPVDYETWLRRLSRAVDGGSADRGQSVSDILRIKDVAESSGTSGGDW